MWYSSSAICAFCHTEKGTTKEQRVHSFSWKCHSAPSLLMCIKIQAMGDTLFIVQRSVILALQGFFSLSLNICNFLRIVLHTKNKTSIACDSPHFHWVRAVDSSEVSVTYESCKNGNKIAESKMNLEDDHSNLCMPKIKPTICKLWPSRFYVRKSFSCCIVTVLTVTWNP